MKYKFPCGCQFDILSEEKTIDGLPKLDFDIEKIPLDCPAVWEMLKKGLNAGVFQLESQLGKQWLQNLQVDSLKDIIALGALLRPGALHGVDEHGVSMTQHYANRKLGKEEVVPIHPAIADILEKTYQVPCYQEDAMKIVARLANFSKAEQDDYRKSAGKKIASEMTRVENKFLERAKEVGLVTEEEAKNIFNILKAAQRYSFNESHSASYGKRGYQTVYIKSHFPTTFFLKWLQFAKYGNQEESSVQDLLAEAKLLDIPIDLPRLDHLQEDFYWKDGVIRFGLTNIRDVGSTAFKKLLPLAKNVNLSSYYEVLCGILYNLGAASENIIDAGALDYLGGSRVSKKFDLQRLKEIFKTTSKHESAWLQDNFKKYNSLEELFKIAEFGEFYKSKPRKTAGQEAINSWRKPCVSLQDDPHIIIEKELHTLKAVISSSVNDLKIENRISCKELFDFSPEEAKLLVAPQDFMKWKRNNGKMMAKLKVSDETGEANLLMFEKDNFSELYAKLYKYVPVVIEVHKWNDAYVVDNINSI